MLVLGRQVKERLVITVTKPCTFEIEVDQIMKGGSVRIGIDADHDTVKVERKELRIGG